jgi:phage/plasmid-like protein (TIGR03299 family)
MTASPLNIDNIDVVATTNEDDLDTNPLKGSPWAGRGVVLPPNSSVDDALRVAKLDWKVIRASNEAFWYEKKDDKKSKVRIANPKCFTLVRSDNKNILSPMLGDRYKEIQNRTAFEVFYEFVETGGMAMETVGSLSGGKHIWGLAKIGSSFELADGETIEGYFLLMNSHVYGFALKAMFTPVRFPGGHMLIRKINVGNAGKAKKVRETYSMPHSRHFGEERIQEIHELLGIAQSYMDDYEAKARLLSATTLTEEEGVLYLAKLFDPKLIKHREIFKWDMPKTLNELGDSADSNRVIQKVADQLDLFPGNRSTSCYDYKTRDRTAWGYYNAVVHWLDHKHGHKTDTRLESVWMGNNADTKLQALDLSVALAERKTND